MAMGKVQLLTDATATGSGVEVGATEADRGITFPIQVEGITTATVVLEGSFNGTDFTAISGASFTADTCTTLNTTWPVIRANCTAYTSGTINVWMGQ